MLEMGTDGAGAEAQGSVVVSPALPGDIATDSQAVEQARQPICGNHTGNLFGLSGADFIVVFVFRMPVGIATMDIPVRHQLTGDFDLKTPSIDPRRGAVGGGIGHINAQAISLGYVVLLRGEHSQAGIEATVEVLAFNSQFVASTGQWVDRCAVAIRVERLRLEDIGVAGIDRVVFVQVVCNAGIRRHYSAVASIVMNIRVSQWWDYPPLIPVVVSYSRT
ncbi:hypothetical protein D3C81_1471550 [compost metagenome]